MNQTMIKDIICVIAIYFPGLNMPVENLFMSACSGSGQDNISLCSGQDGAWTEGGGYSVPPRVISGVRGKGVSCEEKESSLLEEVAEGALG